MADDNETAVEVSTPNEADTVRQDGQDVDLTATETDAVKVEAEKPADAAAEALAEAKTTEASEETPADKDEATATKSRDERRRDRWNEHTQRTKDAQRAARDAERRAAQLTERLKAYETPAPSLEQFDGDYDQFSAANTAHKVEQTLKAEKERDLADATTEAETAQKAAFDAAAAEFDARQREFAAETPDYEQAMNDALPLMSPEMARQVLASEQGPQAVYYLAKNQADLARIARLENPTEVAREIGRIEGRITLPAPKRITTAPEPVTAVATGSGSQGGFDAEKASVDEMAKLFAKRGVPGFAKK